MRTVTLEIGGSRYRMTTDSDEAHMRSLAEIVNERIAQLGPAAKRASKAQLMAVVALSLAEELQARGGEQEGLRERTSTMLAEAIGIIDGRLAAVARDDSA